MHQRSSPFHARKPSASHSLTDWLGRDQQGASVLATARMMLSVEDAARQILPPALAQACKVARINGQQITLAVPSAAYAARLRQMAPRIAGKLADSGWNLNEISVRVQAGLFQDQIKMARTREAVPLDGQALDAFAALRDALQPGPLADAVGRLLARHRNQDET